MTDQEIKDKLSFLLQQDKVNYNEVLLLSNELMKLDKNNVRFTVDAGIIDRLGSELVAKQETAVSELIKNSYDADATFVELKFKDTNAIGGSLILSDNGIGMSREELINGFMRISSTSKIHNKISPLLKRSRAGQKGIGRFAVQRLGKKLRIQTQSAKNPTYALEIEINWNEYLNDIDLNTITNDIKEIIPLPQTGTILIIDQLVDKWTKASIKRINKYISEIIQPFSLTDQVADKDEFKVSIIKTDNGIDEEISEKQLNVYDYATAVIDGSINHDGLGHLNITSTKLNINEESIIGNDPHDNTIPFDKLIGVKFKAYYFIYKSNLIPKLHETAIQKLASYAGGMKLYRNGFRVLPYGEPGDDWLKLDASTRRRTLLPVHANINFFGFVEIMDDNYAFQETSSREGLIENEAFIQLQNFVYRSILTAVIRIAEARNIKIVSNQQKYDNSTYEKIEISINNIATTIEELDKILEEEQGTITTKKAKKQFTKAKEEFLRLKRLQKEERERTFQEKSMLRVLSSIGLTIGQFIHEIKYYLINITADINFLLKNSEEYDTIHERMLVLEKNFAEFNIYTSYFNNVMSNNVVRQLEPIEIRTVVNDFIQSIAADCSKSGIQILEPIYHDVLLYTRPMHTSEWSSILFNFFTNSKKAILKTKNNGCIGIECGSLDKMIYLEFSDNGIGIPPENEDKIFDEFFTTTATLNYDDIDDTTNAVLGTGLGLKIVKDIVESYKGKIFVTTPKDEFNTCIRVEIPMLNDKDFEKYGL